MEKVRPVTMLPLGLRQIAVSAIMDLTPHLRRIRFTGEDLQGGTRDGQPLLPFFSPNFDDHVKLVFPHEGKAQSVPGVQTEKGVEWNRDAFNMARDYSIRTQGQGWIEVEFVLHPGGLASTWATRCQVGDAIYMAGPRGTRALPTEVSYLLIADETGMPAVARFLDEIESSKKVDVLLEVPTDEDVLTFAARPFTEIHWAIRGGAYQAGYSPLLEQNLRALNFNHDNVLVWAGMEAETLNGIRSYLTAQLGIPSERLDLHGYWRR